MPYQDVVVQATDVALAYGRQVVLADLNLAIRQGEFWCCLGPNGEGKTTLLRAILGDLQPQRGHLWRPPRLAQRQSLGFVPQRCEIPPALPTTVREFVLLGTVGARLRRRDTKQRLDWALERVGLQHMATRSYWALSGGQRQRALVARALVRQPPLLLLDEPTNGLDLPTTETLLELLVNLNRQERMTLLFVTHDVALVARYATHVILVRAGRAVAGPSQEVLTQPHLERVYGVGLQISRDAAGGVSIHVTAAGGRT